MKIMKYLFLAFHHSWITILSSITFFKVHHKFKNLSISYKPYFMLYSASQIIF